jgi:hypothetical protein
LKEETANMRAALVNRSTAIRELKAAEAEEEICKEPLRLRYEHNYLDIRKEMGVEIAESLFPKLTPTRNNASDEESDATIPPKS